MSALDDIRRALTDAYGTGTAHDGLTVDDLMQAVTAERALDTEAWPGELHADRTLIRALRAAMLAHDNPDLGCRLLSAHTAVEARALEGTDADFFQPGRTYTHRHGYDFLCVAVTTHPVTSERLAIGWHSEYGVPIAVGINQWNHEYDGVEPPVAPEAAQ